MPELRCEGQVRDGTAGRGRRSQSRVCSTMCWRRQNVKGNYAAKGRGQYGPHCAGDYLTRKGLEVTSGGTMHKRKKMTPTHWGEAG